MGEALSALAVFAGVLLAVLSAGRRAAAAFNSDERTVVGFALGMAGLAAVTGILLAFGAASRPWLVLALTMALLWGRREAVVLLRVLAAFPAKSRAWPDRVLASAVGGVLALGIAGAVAPETGWDAGVYHFAMARLRAESGEMVVRPDIPLSFVPAVTETLQTTGFILHGEGVASLFSLAFYGGALGLVRTWARRRAGEPAARLATVAWLASGTMILRTYGGDVESALAFWIALALYALDRSSEERPGAYTALAGLAAGAAMGTKYVAGFALLAGTTAWVLQAGSRGPRVAALAKSGLIGAVLASPWYLRNAWITGNPVYPAFEPGWRGAPGWGGFSAASLIAPAAVDGALVVSAVLLGRAAGPGLRWAVGGGLAGLALTVAFAGAANGFRLGAAVHPMLAVGIGAALAAGWGRVSAVARIGGGLVAAGALISTGLHVARSVPRVPAAVGLESKEAFLVRRIDSYWAMRGAAEELPAGRKVLLIEQRAYYCRAPFVTASDVQHYVRFAGVRDAEGLRALFERFGIGAIVVSASPVARTGEFQDMLRRVPGILESAGAELVERRGDTALYRVR